MGNGVSGKASANLKTIYLEVEGRKHKVVFSKHSSSRDIKDLLSSAAGVSRWSNMMLKSQDGSTVCIEPNLPSNTARTFTVSQLKSELAKQLSHLERKVEAEALKAIEMQHLSAEITEIREQIRQDRITWQAIKDNVKTNKNDRRNISISRPMPNFVKMLSLVEHMYQDLGLIEDFEINSVVLRRFLVAIQQNYRLNPFHNFRHCFCVTQMMFSIIHLCNLKDLLSQMDLLVLMTACICHDLDHPGFNNTYQINAQTELAIRYNDISPLENHHAAVAFEVIGQPDCNIFANMSKEDQKKIRQEIVMLILATDMARHSEIVERFKSKLDTFDFHNDDYVSSLKMILIKCCDISNEVRPIEVSEPWADCLLEEYFMQSDREKSEGLPVAPFMDRDKVSKPTAQIGFIKFVLIPLFELLNKLFPQVAPVMIMPLREAYESYEIMRLDEEAIKAAATDSVHTDENGMESCSLMSSSSKARWSPTKAGKPTMGVSREIREMFHDKNPESKQAEARSAIKNQKKAEDAERSLNSSRDKMAN
ncbi:High affinity cAMP-specific and IBMX-insensitive 3',5'-cyclic phosphodiesterase 9A [Desmophyllum pertusum]|uniref:Phosphodiesterase n=1 Tax=Desmophyllum pertusum TaxID=174260 RepID=A0A9W9ZM57_9CNID|nr:High affinity cAMP-specific and IBMX-insensitive 3',5'-cyclic phosphodiesterase 9A [Desmophyllum pertusum]